MTNHEHSPAVQCRSERRRQCGFTLIELMITVSIAGILTTVALPSFEGQLQRSRRTDALVSAMQVQLAQERYRSNGAAYGTLAEIGVAPASSAGHYALRIEANDANGFALVATAVGLQARDAVCRNLKLSSLGMSVAYTSGSDAALTNPSDANRRCWNL